ncbi:MAG TPA: SpoIIE family protein phosphatase [Candidatus Borkfalkia excrementipullorum]|nr:SpoIIE family protein phosphatase [Candidatus Borkfalkia excrementipullorum]
MAQKIRFRYNYKAVLTYLALFAGMLLLNFTMQIFEPFSLALFAAALACGFNPLACAGLYILAGGLSFAAGGIPFAVFAVQGALLGGIFLFYERTRRAMKAELALYLFLAAALFFWLFGAFVYRDYLRAAIVAAVIFIFCFVFIGAMRCILVRAGKMRLSPEDFVFCAAAVAALGVGLYNCAGSYVYESVALLGILLACGLLRNGNAAFCALVLSLPPAICGSVAAAAPQLVVCAEYVLYAALALAFLRAGKLPAVLAVFLADVAVRYLTDFYSAENIAGAFASAAFYLTMLVPLIPCLLFALLPEKLLNKCAARMRRFGERQLTRESINRNRAMVGEKLYEVSAAFREIEATFSALDDDTENDGARRRFILEEMEREVCAGCERRNECGQTAREEGLQKLVDIGCGKGKVNLIDLPSDLASACRNPSALLFSLNKLLAEYRRHAVDEENAAAGRKLLADQAHAVAEMLKHLALSQSAPVGKHLDAERELRGALAAAGIACEEVFIGGESPDIYITAAGNISAAAMRTAAERALGIPLILASKSALAADKYCYLFRKRPALDAAFGVASRTKDGESACGDTHSVIKIDERTFLCALSDGMGSGPHARRISDTSLSLIESFYRAGLSGDAVLSTVNRLLAFGREESFACIDTAAVDLDSGRADIVKIGSPLAFLLTETQTEILESESLPLGILDGVRPTVLSRKLNDGDVLVFLSDGITAAFGSSADIADFLGNMRISNPQAVADDLLAGALERTGGIAPDDMTVLAVRLLRAEDAAA